MNRQVDGTTGAWTNTQKAGEKKKHRWRRRSERERESASEGEGTRIYSISP